MELIYKYTIPDKLYHGSPARFRIFDLEKAHALKDYGKGFYLTTNYEQAFEWANKKRLSKDGYIYEYSIDKKKIMDIKFNIIEFLDYSISWGHFIAAHRHEIIEDAGLDIVYDRMADGTSQEMTEAIDKFYKGDDGSEKNMMNVFTNIKAENSKYDQYCFKTQRAINLLCCERVAILSGDFKKPDIVWKGAFDFYEQQKL